MAERVVDDLLGAAMAVDDRDVRDGAEVLSAWDLTAAADSRGGVLFERWADQYFDGTADSLAGASPGTPGERIPLRTASATPTQRSMRYAMRSRHFGTRASRRTLRGATCTA